MENSPFAKPSKKGIIFPVIFYILAVVLLITAIVSLAACHQNIAMQLEQGVPVKGNELVILNLYLTSCVQYFTFAAAMVFCGSVFRKVMALKAPAPETVSPYMPNAPVDGADSSFAEKIEPEEDDTEFEAWGVKE